MGVQILNDVATQIYGYGLGSKTGYMLFFNYMSL